MTTTARTVAGKLWRALWRALLQGGVGVTWLCHKVGKREGRGEGQQVGGGEGRMAKVGREVECESECL